ncbi:mucin-16 [Emydura macquarii macquarii]|uniref:mucin-16 n=1 Tax=Emydura macquarii macquarii TaxID=1129001 RepID=UPI00352A99D6
MGETSSPRLETTSAAEPTAITDTTTIKGTTTVLLPTTTLPGSTALASSTIPETSTAALETSSPAQTIGIISTPTVEEPQSTAGATSPTGETSISTLGRTSAVETTAITRETTAISSTPTAEKTTIVPPSTSTITENPTVATSIMPETSTTPLETTSPTAKSTITGRTTLEETTILSLPTTSQAQKTSTTPLETTSPTAKTTITGSTTLEETTILSLPTTSQAQSSAAATSKMGETSSPQSESTAVASSTLGETPTSTLHNTSPSESTAITSTTTVAETTILSLPTTSEPQRETSISTLGRTSAVETTAITSTTAIKGTTAVSVDTTTAPGSTAIATSTVAETSTAALGTSSPGETTAISSTPTAEKTTIVPPSTSTITENPTVATSIMPETSTTPLETTSPTAKTTVTGSTTLEETTILSLPTTSQAQSSAAATSKMRETSSTRLETTSAAEPTAITDTTTIKGTTTVLLPTTTLPGSTALASSTIPETSTAALETSSPAQTTGIISTTTVEAPGSTAIATSTVAETSTAALGTSSPGETTAISSTPTAEKTTIVPPSTSTITENPTVATSIMPETSTTPLETTSPTAKSTITETSTTPLETTSPTAKTTITGSTTLEETTILSLPTTSQAQSSAAATSKMGETSSPRLETTSAAEPTTTGIISTTTVEGTTTLPLLTSSESEKTTSPSETTSMTTRTTIEETSTVPPPTTMLLGTTTSLTYSIPETSTAFLKNTSLGKTTPVSGATAVEETTTITLPTTTLPRSTAAATSSASHGSTAPLETTSLAESTEMITTTTEEGTTTVVLPTISLPGTETKTAATSMSAETSTSAPLTSSLPKTTALIGTSASKPTTISLPASSPSLMTVEATTPIAETSTSPLETTSPPETPALAAVTTSSVTASTAGTSTVSVLVTSPAESTVTLTSSTTTPETSTSSLETSSPAKIPTALGTTTELGTPTASTVITQRTDDSSPLDDNYNITFTYHNCFDNSPSVMTAAASSTVAETSTSSLQTTFPALIPSITPAPAIAYFTVNFTITNLQYTSELGTPNSMKFNATEKALTSLLDPILGNSSIGPAYIGCEVKSYRPVRAGNDTGIDALCIYRNGSTIPPFDKVGVYHEISKKTNGITKLGPYTLDKDSLYVNGYNEAPALPTVSPMPTLAPAIEHFTLNFTITNLRYASELGTPHSTRFNATEKVLISLLNPIFGNSSIGPDYIRCEVTAYRPVRAGNDTGVDAVCTYRHDSTAPPFDRVGVYREVSNKTNSITKLGPYILDKNSLYVNGYNEASPVPTLNPSATPTPAIAYFTVNFTITNLQYTSELGTPNSMKFNATEKALTSLLDPILGNSSIGPAYIGCEVKSYRPMRAGNDTGIDALCIYRNGSTIPPFDKVGVYHEISKKTNGITKLGPYTLDKDSLYVNGYNEAPALPTVSSTPTSAPAIEHFTLNFTITNLRYASELGTPHSTSFNATEKVLISLLNPIFGNSSIGPDYIRCEVTAYRPVRAGNDTGVDTVCTYKHDSAAPPFDRVGVYREVSNKTNSITKLGPYILDKNSLYVNGYSEASPVPTLIPSITAAPAIAYFTVNFTITNLQYTSELGNPNSMKFNATEKALTSLLDPILGNSSIGPAYIGCEVKSYRPVRAGNDTGIDAVCTYRNGSTIPPFDKVGVYHEITKKTNGITKLGPYSLDKDSLYVNGYNEAPALPTVSPTPTSAPAIEHFTLNFTITNLRYASELGIPHSTRFNATEKVLISLLNPIFQNSSIGPAYIRCEVTAYRPVRAGNDTGIDALCIYRNGSTIPPFDKVGVYHEISKKTNGITKLGPYTLDKDSLYVNGYNEAPALPTVSPTPTLAPAIEHFTVNFTITNLRYASELGTPHSTRFNATEKVLISLLNPIFGNSSIGPAYIRCEVTAYRPVRAGNDTGVDTVCTYKHDSAAPPFDRVGVYREVSNKTNSITKLGPYVLDKNSLYVNGYNEASPVPTVILATIPAPTVEYFTVNFTITNLQYSPELEIRNSKIFNVTEKVLTSLLDPLFKNSSIGPLYMGCKVMAYRPVKNGDDTGVDALCTYRNISTTSRFDRAKVYRELRNKTNGITKLGPYSLDDNSLYVNGYNEARSLPTMLPTTTSAPAPTVEHFTVNFTVTNLQYTSQLGTPNSLKFNNTEKVLTSLLDPLLKTSSIGSDYIGCKVMAYSPVRNGDGTHIDALCTYRNDSTRPKFDRAKVYHELSNKTRDITKLGPYNLDNTSLYVNGYNEPRTVPPLKPTTTIAPSIATGEHFTVNFTITNLPYNSKTFNTTSNVLTYMLDRLLRNSSIGLAYTGCKVVALRPVKNGDDTGMDATCTYRNESTTPKFDRMKIYRELSSMTNGSTRLGPYILDNTSFYVNGYNEPQPVPSVNTTTQTPSLTTEHFTLNFTLTNLRFTTDLGMPGSPKFTSTEKIMLHYINPLLKNSSIGPHYIGCKVMAFRSVKNRDDTGVDAFCSYRNNPIAPRFDRVKVYHELNRMTNNITQLGRYTLDNKSLYVNGYNEALLGPNLSLTTPQSPTDMHFTMNFTLTNLRYTTDLGIPGSHKFNSTEKIMILQIEPLLRNSSIGPVYTGCKVMAIRSVNNKDDTGIDVVCSYKNNATVAKFDRVRLYDELSSVTKLGPYTMEKNSLYVNGFRRSAIAITTKPPSTVAPENRAYQLTFKIINVNLTNPDPKSSAYQALLKDISDKINQLYSQSDLRDKFLFCNVSSLRIGSVVVDCQCFFKPGPNPSEADVHNAFQNGTRNESTQWLGGRYQLQEDLGNGVETVIKPVTQTPIKAERESFRLNFTITNLLYSSELKQPNSNAYRLNKQKIEKELDNIFRISSIQKYFVGCSVESFRPIPGKTYTGVNSICKFMMDSTSRSFQREEVYEEFKRLTNGVTELGESYSLAKDSLLVNDYSPLNTMAGEPGISGKGF